MRRVHLLTALELPPTTPDGDYQGVQAAATLALFGWTMVAEERGAGKGQQAVLSCELCFRQAGTHRPPRARLPASSAWAGSVSIPLCRGLSIWLCKCAGNWQFSCHSGAWENEERRVKRRRPAPHAIIDRADADGLFDPIREHRDFCPFVVPPAQVDDTASKVPSEPGYKYILNAIAP